jgi:hypothetical protein
MTDATLQRRFRSGGLAVCAAMIAGCLSGPAYPPPGMSIAQPGPGQPMEPFPPVAAQNNPVFIPVQDPNLMWDQLVDVVDDYFEIDHENRVRIVGDEPTEGRIDTFPRGSSTIFEPWNNDSVTRHERWEATLQSMRRTGTLRVFPADGGFLVEVVVLKELEDVAKPDAVFVGDESLRNDNSIRRFNNNVKNGGESLGWIPKGRDGALEQEIIWQLQSRFCAQAVPQTPVFLGENPPAQPPPTAQWKPSGSGTTSTR